MPFRRVEQYDGEKGCIDGTEMPVYTVDGVSYLIGCADFANIHDGNKSAVAYRVVNFGADSNTAVATEVRDLEVLRRIMKRCDEEMGVEPTEEPDLRLLHDAGEAGKKVYKDSVTSDRSESLRLTVEDIVGLTRSPYKDMIEKIVAEYGVPGEAKHLVDAIGAFLHGMEEAANEALHEINAGYIHDGENRMAEARMDGDVDDEDSEIGIGEALGVSEDEE